MIKQKGKNRPDWRLVAVVATAAVAFQVLRIALRTGAPFLADTDDAMRMVMVRDFLGGQGWYDLVQHRLNAPWGAEIHWSRLVDLPLAALIALFAPIAGAAGAEIIASYAWPMILLVLHLWVSARLAYRLVGPDGVLPALILPVLSPAITAEFVPGRIDHHNLIILLTLAITLSAMEALRRPGYGVVCGVLCATALAIAVEALPTIVAAIAVMGVLWVFAPERGGATRCFGYSFALASAVHLMIFRMPQRWLEPACDVLSPAYVLAALLVAVGFGLITLVPRSTSIWLRCLALGGVGLAAIAIVVWAYPQCLGGPYGSLDPWLRQNWIAGIAEAKPWLDSASDLPTYTLAVGLPVFFSALLVMVRLWKVREDRGAWGVLLIFLLCSALVMLAQVRGARLAIMPAMPAAAWLITIARKRFQESPKPIWALGLVASWLIFSGIAISVAVSTIVNAVPGRAQLVAQVRADRQPCMLPGAFELLQKQPQARIMAPIDLGSHLLLYTRHAVVAAPYHRNQMGVLDTFRFFNAPIAEARSILETRGIDLVVTCPAMPEMRGLVSRASDSFISLVEAGTIPPWLVKLDAPGPLQIYTVQPSE